MDRAQAVLAALEPRHDLATVLAAIVLVEDGARGVVVDVGLEHGALAHHLIAVDREEGCHLLAVRVLPHLAGHDVGRQVVRVERLHIALANAAASDGDAGGRQSVPPHRCGRGRGLAVREEPVDPAGDGRVVHRAADDLVAHHVDNLGEVRPNRLGELAAEGQVHRVLREEAVAHVPIHVEFLLAKPADDADVDRPRHGAAGGDRVGAELVPGDLEVELVHEVVEKILAVLLKLLKLVVAVVHQKHRAKRHERALDDEREAIRRLVTEHAPELRPGDLVPVVRHEHERRDVAHAAADRWRHHDRIE